VTKHSPDEKAEHELPPGENVSRIAERLARVSLDLRVPSEPAIEDSSSDKVQITKEAVIWLIEARRKRSRYLPGGLFGDPVWDMLLHVLHAGMTGRRASVSSVCMATDLPRAVALRWLDAMRREGLVVRQDDPNHAGKEFVELTAETAAALRRYFRDVVEDR
jgi:DNA-binding transcriptional ArsR family regulator